MAVRAGRIPAARLRSETSADEDAMAAEQALQVDDA
jgi:hypothetical protein